jgi:uncharacterized damage-inducible protein DinB
MAIMEPILAEIEQESVTTRKLLERVPEDKLSWRPHHKCYSLGQLALHIASIPGALSAAVAVDSLELPKFQQPEAKSKSEILDTFSKSLAQARENLARIDDAKALATWTVTRNGATVMSLPRIQFMRAILLNHCYHHRGQLSIYLRQLDVPLPSIYGPSADENPFG